MIILILNLWCIIVLQSSSFSLSFLNIELLFLKQQMSHFSASTLTLIQHLKSQQYSRKTNLFSVVDDLFWSFCFLAANKDDIIAI